MSQLHLTGYDDYYNPPNLDFRSIVASFPNNMQHGADMFRSDDDDLDEFDELFGATRKSQYWNKLCKR